MQKFAVIFDMDGVLVDSLRHVETVFNHVLKPHGLTVAQLHAKHGHLFGGHSSKHIVKILAEHHGVEMTEQEFEDAGDEIFFRRIAAEKVTADPAVVRLLSQLRAAGSPLAVVSNSPRQRIARLLDFLKVSDYFPVTVGTEDALKHKPDPEIFLVAAKRMAVAPSTCVVIEDMPGGITGAKQAGMKTIGHLAYHQDKNFLNHADLLIHSFSELTPAKIQKLLN